MSQPTFEKTADLHLHTVFSDGTYTVKELIAAALRQKLSTISITDHDTVSAIAPAIEAGQAVGIEVLPGVELSTEYEDKEVHLLGYLFDYKQESLLIKLDIIRKNRIERIYKIVERLQKQGVELNPEVVFEISGNGTPGRLHIARALVKTGVVESVFEAFRKYIGDRCPAYVSGFKLSVAEGIEMIRAARGIPVLAHPYSMNNDELIAQFACAGLMGLEAYYPEHTPVMVNRYVAIAGKLNLLVTGGTDCHGDGKPEVKIGSLKIPYELVEKLKKAKETL